MSEADIGSLVVEWLQDQHWDVYQEVQVYQYGPIADIMAVQDGRLWAIECKTSLTFKVLEQASGWGAHYRSIAVPYAKNRHSGYGLAYRVARDMLQVGVLEVLNIEPDYYCSPVKVEVDAPLVRHNRQMAKFIMGKLSAEHKTCAQAGSNNGGHYTPYRSTIEAIKRFISQYPGCYLCDIMAEIGKGHYSTTGAARASIKKALETWESDWCLIDGSGREARYYIRTRGGGAMTLLPGGSDGENRTPASRHDRTDRRDSRQERRG